MASPDSIDHELRLVSKIEASRDAVNVVSAIAGDGSVIVASDDKTVQVWVERENGQYWSSINQSFGAACSALVCEQERDGDGHKVFVGLGNGQVQEFRMSRDLNRFERRKVLPSHNNRVTALKLISDHNWILSTGRDKRLLWSCTGTNRNLGTYEATAWCMAVEYDETKRYAFVAEYNGDISVVLLEENNFHKLTQLKGHTGSVWTLGYDPERRMLYSGGFDRTIVVWNIGSHTGTSYELTGHTNKVRSLVYLTAARKLLSTGEDGCLWVWDMNERRDEVPIWEKSDRCEVCGSAFFWNFRGMWNDKSLPGRVIVRQHHCRKCGRAVCASCANLTSTYPRMGFEMPVKMCNDCHSSTTPQDRSPLATSVNLKLNITSLSVLQGQELVVTASEDKCVRIWDISQLLK